MKFTSSQTQQRQDRRLRLLVVIQALWAATLVVLVLWWGTLISKQSDEIANLTTQLGGHPDQIQDRLDRTRSMILGESGLFITLTLITNIVLIYLFLRDHRRSKSLHAFFASLTHEIKTPLTSIRLQAEALRDLNESNQTKPFIDRLFEDAERLEDQVSKTLELARLEGGGKVHTQPLNLKSFIEQKVVSKMNRFPNRIQFTANLEEGSILGDSAALHMIFRNLSDNAIKYTSVPPAKVEIKGFQKDGSYVLQFHHLNSNFKGSNEPLGELFSRGKNSVGAGVGLYLIRELMRQMGGQTRFNTQTEKTFFTELHFQGDHHD